jgi:hypothetical protein
VRLTIRGIQEAQAANNRWMAAVRPRGALGRAVQDGMVAAQRYAVAITHVDTGALRASHRMAFREESRSAHGTISIDPASVNPHGQRPAVYGPVEHGRGGSHAFYERVVSERGLEILQQMAGVVGRELR